MIKPQFSIITVCYNAENTIQETMKSVLNQNYYNYEYIIIDGLSTDNTNKIIMENITLFKKKGINVVHLSEKDKGIYDAMNKGINICKGGIIYFLNSGDSFTTNTVLSNISNYSGYDILYGGINADGSINTYPKVNMLYFLREKMICHQAIFASKKTFENNLFDLKYKICSDRNWLIKSYRLGFKFIKVDEIICVYDTTGYSSGDYVQKQINEESINLLQQNFGNAYKYVVKIKRILSLIIKRKFNY